MAMTVANWPPANGAVDAQSLEEARQTIEAWRIDYNTERPHRALGQQAPAAW
jgi:transposase InsO family protein